ncbi:MAG: EAL domain-containing protein [Xanthomonadaceae bacterium]|nr:EAL domain-containing protein [Xanthomonadaceae bacterium]MDE2307297.1 EAL domain-containing protein [Xanthomonadaceae bacterium]
MKDFSDGTLPSAIDDAARTPSAAGRLHGLLWALLALLCGLALTLGFRHQQWQRQVSEQHDALQRQADEIYDALGKSMQRPLRLLRFMQTLYLASDDVTAAEFARMYENLVPRRRMPEMIALSFARRVVRPDGVHFVVEQYAPAAGNETLAGLVVETQPASLAALRASRDTGQPTLSAPFRLVQRNAAGVPIDGVVMRLPIYSHGEPPRTQDERRLRMIGSAAVSLQMSGLVASVLSVDPQANLRMQVSDVTDGRVRKLFESSPAALPPLVADRADRFERELVFGARAWRVTLQANEPPPAFLDWRAPVLTAGVLSSMLLALLVWSLFDTRRRALELGWQMSRSYRQSEERFRALNEQLPALVLLAAAEDGRIIYANRAARDRFGQSLDGGTLPALFEDQDGYGRQALLATAGIADTEAVLHAGSDVRFWASLSISRVQLDDRSQLLMVAADITEQRALHERLLYQATHDELTGLCNRSAFESRLKGLLAGLDAPAPASALLYVDLDQFKLINDTNGHAAGDQMLVRLAEVMRAQLSGDDVLARLGGDEFGVLAVRRGDVAAVAQLAERLRRCIEDYVFPWENHKHGISASIGVALIDRPDCTLQALLAHADTACSMAKEQGRNRVHVYAGQHEETVRRRREMEWANRLRRAIDRNRLVLAYQEVWPLLPSVMAGARIELLLRYRDKAGQLVLPGEFLPAAERYGLMPMIDRWVIETALANFAQLHPAGCALQLVTINLSGASIEDDALAERIVELSQHYRVPPERVCFEITETIAVGQLTQVARFMARLRKIGCKVALDDFGTGMSSFAYLKNLPVDIIKIDGSFIQDMHDEPISHAMVCAVADIGRRLGLDVVAEWVNDEATEQALAELGIGLAQGNRRHMPELVLCHRSRATNPDS